MSTVSVGKTCESSVCKYLEEKGYIIEARNYHCKCGEIDIIARLESKLCFVEVKSFPSSWPMEDISYKVSVSKQFKIKKTASEFLETEEHIKYDSLRFDVAVVSGSRITYFEGAF